MISMQWVFNNFLHQDPPDISIPEHYTHQSLSHYTRLSYNQQLIILYLCPTSYYQKSSFPHTIIDWNNLPNKIECSTLDEFLHRLRFL